MFSDTLADTDLHAGAEVVSLLTAGGELAGGEEGDFVGGLAFDQAFPTGLNINSIANTNTLYAKFLIQQGNAHAIYITDSSLHQKCDIKIEFACNPCSCFSVI